jgi:hypothetical protein
MGGLSAGKSDGSREHALTDKNGKTMIATKLQRAFISSVIQPFLRFSQFILQAEVQGINFFPAFVRRVQHYARSWFGGLDCLTEAPLWKRESMRSLFYGGVFNEYVIPYCVIPTVNLQFIRSFRSQVVRRIVTIFLQTDCDAVRVYIDCFSSDLWCGAGIETKVTARRPQNNNNDTSPTTMFY